MSPVDLDLDKELVAEVRGAIYPSMDPEHLREDLIEIKLVNGLTVEAGWIPQGDPNGRFRITVFEEYWTEQKATATARTPTEAADMVSWLVEQYGDHKSAIDVHASSAQEPEHNYDPILTA